MLFDRWKAEAAQIAAGQYGIDIIDRVPKAFLWHLFVDHIPPWEAATHCRNLIDAQDQPDIPKRVKRG